MLPTPLTLRLPAGGDRRGGLRAGGAINLCSRRAPGVVTVHAQCRDGSSISVRPTSRPAPPVVSLPNTHKHSPTSGAGAHQGGGRGVFG